MRTMVVLAFVALTSALHAPQFPLPANSSPTFEVASIKENKDFSQGMNGCDCVNKGRYTVINFSLPVLIAAAHNFDLGGWRDRLIGLPAWANSAKYDITATAGSLTATRAQTHAMLLELLKDRFKLVTHLETRQIAVYELVIASPGGRLGSGMRPFVGDCKVLAASGKGVCQASATGYKHRATGMPLGNLMSQISMSVDRRIVDRTGLTGSFDWEFQAPSDPTDPTAPSIFTAVQEQLGLKLQPTRIPLEVAVIDHIEPPTPD